MSNVEELRGARSSAAVPERPALAPGVELVGQLRDSGFADTQWLVQRDGRYTQLTELLYRVAESVDGERSLEDIAAEVTNATEWLVTAENVRHLLLTRLIPSGLISGSTTRRPARTTSPLTLNMRVRAVGAQPIDRVARVLQYLFAPPVLVVALVVIAVSHAWLYGVHGVTGAFIDALYTPSSLLVVVGVSLLAAVVHEFGHASALRYGGGRARGMGAGIYLVFPAFYTDVTESYRLGRRARLRTDLGGVYFHLLSAVAVMGTAVVFDVEFLLVAVLLINIEVLRQFIPFVRLDGYWMLADLTGVPDFFSQMGPFVRGLIGRIRGRSSTAMPRLKRWVEVVFAAYVVITIPLLVLLLGLFVKVLPRVATAIWDAVGTQVAFVSASYQQGDAVGVATAVVQLVLLGLPVLGIGYLLYSLTWKPLRAVWRTRTPRLRLAGTLAILAVATSVAFLWAPYLPFAGDAPPTGVQTFEVVGRRHLSAPVTYAQSPPVGGDHAPIWQNCGFYGTAIPDENAVHALEHGAVWIAYRPELPRTQVETLRRFAESDYVLISPRRGLETSVVVSSWGRQLALASARDARLRRFVDVFRLDERAPEHGGPCAGGKGTPE